MHIQTIYDKGVAASAMMLWKIMKLSHLSPKNEFQVDCRSQCKKYIFVTHYTCISLHPEFINNSNKLLTGNSHKKTCIGNSQKRISKEPLGKGAQSHQHSEEWKLKPQDITQHPTGDFHVKYQQGRCGVKGTLRHYCYECKLVKPLWKTGWHNH